LKQPGWIISFKLQNQQNNGELKNEHLLVSIQEASEIYNLIAKYQPNLIHLHHYYYLESKFSIPQFEKQKDLKELQIILKLFNGISTFPKNEMQTLFLVLKSIRPEELEELGFNPKEAKEMWMELKNKGIIDSNGFLKTDKHKSQFAVTDNNSKITRDQVKLFLEKRYRFSVFRIIPPKSFVEKIISLRGRDREFVGTILHKYLINK